MTRNKSVLHNRKIIQVLYSSLVGGVSGALITYLHPLGSIWYNWFSNSLLMGIATYFLWSSWHWAGGQKRLAWMIFAAFAIRLAVGISFSLLLPQHGYDEPVQKAGYLFYDAYTRDLQAWQLADSGRSLLLSFQDEFWADQYGGLLGLSAAVYRFLSPDAHRPFLILILGAFTAALGIPFFWKATSYRWDKNIANLAAWIVILYPDGILYASSQMREPFLVGLFCIAFWGAVHWTDQRGKSVLALGISLFISGLFSILVAAGMMAALSLWLWLDHLSGNLSGKTQKWIWLGICMLALVALLLGFDWLRESASWDLLLTEQKSGWVAKSIEEIGRQLRIPFIVGYGLAQPVLPAAIAQDAIPLWKVIGIFRSAGWYALIPLLITPVFLVWRMPADHQKKIFIWLTGMVYCWILVSSFRAGGDQWDNPRYRTILIPWLALLAAWTVTLVKTQASPWLFRIIFVEIIFLTFFTGWYFSRYFLLWDRLTFWSNIAWIIGLSLLVIFGGLLWDHFRAKALSRRKDNG